MALIGNVLYGVCELAVLVVILQVVLSYLLPPYHQVRQIIDRFVEPMLQPIRRVVPPVGGLDFSPMVLVILLQILGSVLRYIFYSF
jgi:YggT family protein